MYKNGISKNYKPARSNSIPRFNTKNWIEVYDQFGNANDNKFCII